MIVWDSPEAEKRSARRHLESRTREMVQARRHLRTNTISTVVLYALAAVNAAFLVLGAGRVWLSLLAIAVTCTTGTVQLLYFRPKFKAFLVGAVERWDEAQDRYDRVLAARGETL